MSTQTISQPDSIEVGNTGFSCGECGFHFLDRVFLTTDDGEETCLACRDCGWTDTDEDQQFWYVNWFREMYDPER